MNKSLYLLTTICLILSAAIHISTFFLKIPIPTVVFLLHFICILSLFPAFFQLRLGRRYINSQNWTEYFFTGKAKRYSILTILLFIYSFLNSFITSSVLNQGLSADFVNGQYVLQDHGDIVKIIDKAEYIRNNLYQLRLFSSGWMFFFCFSATLFAVLIHESMLERQGVCKKTDNPELE